MQTQPGEVPSDNARMSLARAVIPGRCYMITRRCSERRFFMRPDAETTNAFIYCLALAARRCAVKVLFTAAMSNHHHTGIVDTEGRFPEFLAYFHKLFAKHQNALRGRWENFWASEQASVVELITADDVLDKMVYALSNPAKDHLVERVVDWPGVDALSAIVAGVPLIGRKPTRFFRPDGELPETMALEFDRPPGFESWSDVEFGVCLRRRIAAVEAQAAAARRRSKLRVLGRAAILRQSWRDCPRSREPRRKLRPHVACKNTWRRIEALSRNKMFLTRYAACRDSMLAGACVPFPIGTYWLPRFAKIPCDPDPRSPS
jgi:putative transposase